MSRDVNFGLTPEQEEAENAIRNGYQLAKEGYDGECENCHRQRVELFLNGKRICEKCHWDQDAHDYDATHRQIFG